MIRIAGQSFPAYTCPTCGMKTTDPADITICQAIHKAFKPAGPSWRELKDIRKAAKMARIANGNRPTTNAVKK